MEQNFTSKPVALLKEFSLQYRQLFGKKDSFVFRNGQLRHTYNENIRASNEQCITNAALTPQQIREISDYLADLHPATWESDMDFNELEPLDYETCHFFAVFSDKTRIHYRMKCMPCAQLIDFVFYLRKFVPSEAELSTEGNNDDDEMLFEDYTLDWESIIAERINIYTKTEYLAKSHQVKYFESSNKGNHTEYLDVPKCIQTKRELKAFVKEIEPFWIRHH